MPMRRDHQPPGDAIGDLGAMVTTDQMQAAIDRGGRTRRGQDIAVVDIERVPIQPDPRIGSLEFIGPGPMRRRGAAIEQAGARQDESPEAQSDDSRSARMGCAQGIEQDVGWLIDWIAPGRNDHGIGLRQGG